MKELVTNEYLRRVKALARSKLYSKNLFDALNSWAVSVVRYSAGILNWRENELKAIDVKTRKVLTMNGIFHKKGNVDRVYIKRKLGGRGLISVEDCVRMEERNLRNYLRGDACVETLVLATSSVLLGIEQCKEEGNHNGACTFECYREESGAEYKTRVSNERVERVSEMKMHGRFFREVSNVLGDSMFEWVASGSVNKSTEGLVFAAQEQALPTNFLKAKITGESEDANCRVCKKELETVTHLVSSCSGLAQREYKRRHDRMGLRVYWEICKKYGMKCSEHWYTECPEKVRKSECGFYEVWWDRPVETTKRLEHNKPDVVIIDRKRKLWTFIDFSVPNDKNVLLKGEEKKETYKELANEIRRIHKVRTKIVPIVVGALGVLPSNLEENLKYLEMPYVIRCLQVSAVIGSSIILRKILNI